VLAAEIALVCVLYGVFFSVCITMTMGSNVSVRMAFNVDVRVTHCKVAFLHTIILLTVGL